MRYDIELYQIELDALIGEVIENVFFHINYEDSPDTSFKQLSSEVIEVLRGNILIETKSGLFFRIIETDYSKNLDLGGLCFEKAKKLIPEERPNQINEPFWGNFSDKKIVNSEIFEDKHLVNSQLMTIPLGIKLNFEGDSTLFIMNLCIEKFIESKGLYKFLKGEEIVLFNNENIFNKHKTLEENELIS